MELFAISLMTALVAEIGDRSLLLAVLFGVRYERIWPIFWGMVTGLLVNQAVSAVAGVWLFALIPSTWHSWLIGITFLVMGVWILFSKDERLRDSGTAGGLFVTSAVAFFLLEMADKTQLAVIALAGVTQNVAPVILGATLGILLITTPALLIGNRFAAWLPVKWIRTIGAVLLLLLGGWTLLEASGSVPPLLPVKI